MNEIQKGDYVRIRDVDYGEIIARIDMVLNKDYEYKNMRMYRIDTMTHQPRCYPNFEIYKEDIIKHSSNIIDLIEVGDYVNGERVEAVDYTEDEQGNYIDVLGTMEIEDDFAYPIILRNEDINSIVTHQQFKEMEYKV